MPKREAKHGHLPWNVARRIVERSAHNRIAVVVPRHGKPARVFDLEKYLKMMEQPKKHKPWSHRRARANPPEPLGAVEGSVLGSLSREKIYE